MNEKNLVTYERPSFVLLILSLIHFGATLLILIGKNSGGTGSVEDTYSVAILYLILFSMIGISIGVVFGIIGFIKKKIIYKAMFIILSGITIITMTLFGYINFKFNVFVNLPIGASFNNDLLNLVFIFMLIETLVLFLFALTVGFLSNIKN